MATKTYIALPDRALLALSGADVRPFLQGLISNDVDKLAPARAIHAALLTPQGKYLYDFFVFELDGRLLLDCEAAGRDGLARRIGMYRLRAKVAIEPCDELAIFALIGAGAAAAAGALAGGVVYADPRLAAMGARAALPAAGTAALEAAGFVAATRSGYDALRTGLGVPDGSRDLVADKSFPLENGFEELHGVDFDKGCFVGQEVTARMKYRGKIRKRLMPVEIVGEAPAPGTRIMHGALDAGEMRSAADGSGLALLRLERADAAAAEGAALTAGQARIVPRRPDWARF